jgi:hypothetical protein
MARQFLTVNQADIDLRIARAIRSRENELAAYDFEKEHHESIIANAGDISWSSENEAFKGLPRDAAIAKASALGLSEQDTNLILNLLMLDAAKHGLTAVSTELQKSEQHYATLLSQLPEGARRDAAFATLALEQAQP